jgi:hypothetical protein
MAEKTKQEMYQSICFKAQDTLKNTFVIDIEDLVCSRANPEEKYRVVYLNLKSIVLIKTFELDTYHFDDEFFGKLMRIKEGEQIDIKEVFNDFIIVDAKDFESKYYVYITLGHLLHRLNNMKKLSEQTFFNMYHFIKNERFKYSFFREIDEIGNVYNLYALYILFFMDEMNYCFDFEKEIFIPKEQAEEKDENIVI